MASSFSFNMGDLEKGLSLLEDRAKIAVKIKVSQASQELKSYAQIKAPWTDRTGQARRMIDSYFYELSTSGYRIVLAHGVDYGIWLELANEKKYAIIQPTINIVGVQKIMPSFEKFLEKLRS